MMVSSVTQFTLISIPFLSKHSWIGNYIQWLNYSFYFVRIEILIIIVTFTLYSLLDDDWLAERMNNALNIYSNNLNGLMILVDKRINSFRGIKKRKLVISITCNNKGYIPKNC